MSWKPCRGSGITFEKAFNREVKYRMQLAEIVFDPVSIKQHSKIYYHWLVAQRDVKNAWNPHSCKIEDLYGQQISKNALQQFAQHKKLCYKPLQKYIK